MARRPRLFPSYGTQPIARLAYLLLVLCRCASAYPPTLSSRRPSVDPTYVATHPPTIEQLDQSLHHAAVHDVAVLLLCLHRISFSLLLHPCRFGRFSSLCLLLLLLCILLSCVLLLLSLYGHMPCLLLGCLPVSGGGNVLQSCPFGLVFPLPDLHTNPLPTLATTHVAKLLACAATRPCDVTVHVGVQHRPPTTPALQIFHHLRLFPSRPDHVRLTLLVHPLRPQYDALACGDAIPPGSSTLLCEIIQLVDAADVDDHSDGAGVDPFSQRTRRPKQSFFALGQHRHDLSLSLDLSHAAVKHGTPDLIGV